jgi:hypothetical protein
MVWVVKLATGVLTALVHAATTRQKYVTPGSSEGSASEVWLAGIPLRSSGGFDVVPKYTSTVLLTCATDHTSETLVAMFDAPLGGDVCVTDGELPHGAAPDVVNDRMDEFEVLVASHAACATTNQKTRPGVFGTE